MYFYQVLCPTFNPHSAPSGPLTSTVVVEGLNLNKGYSNLSGYQKRKERENGFNGDGINLQ